MCLLHTRYRRRVDTAVQLDESLDVHRLPVVQRTARTFAVGGGAVGRDGVGGGLEGDGGALPGDRRDGALKRHWGS